MPTTDKLQRWTDLLAALLRHHYPVPFEELARSVPAYMEEGQKKDARMRMFERDKDELRGFGVPIETVQLDEETHAYRLSSTDFYLPYLASIVRDGSGSGKKTEPKKVAAYGYRSLPTITFEPDELTAIADGAIRAQSLGDPVLKAESESALRKVSFDLPLAAASSASDGTHVTTRDSVDREVFELLGDALMRRKRVTFSYSAMSTGHDEERDVEPYGLFFLDSHWYLAARDVSRDALRNFRLTRIRDVNVNRKKSQTADYEIPSTFVLREHASSRQAWELGDAEAVEVTVQFSRESGAAKAVAHLGRSVRGKPGTRIFTVRRTDAFCRWLLSFGGDAVPLEPHSLVREFQEMVDGAIALYT